MDSDFREENGEVMISPHVPEEWEYFSVDNLWIGEKYGFGKGIVIREAD